MIDLDPRSTALVLVDLQNGVLGRKLEPISAETLLERGRALAGRFRAAGALVVLVNAAPRAEETPRQVDEPSPIPEKPPEVLPISRPASQRPAICGSPSTAGARFSQRISTPS